MKRTVQHILGAAVGLVMTVSGAFADPVIITQAPIVIKAPGDYILSPDVVAQMASNPALAYPVAITITSSDVNLDLNEQSIDCPADGLLIGGVESYGAGPVDHVTVSNGTFNGLTPAPYFGLVIGVGSDHISVKNVDFTGVFGYNADYGTSTSLKNCTFINPLNIITQSAPSVYAAGNSTFENLTVSGTSGFSGWNPPTGGPGRALWSFPGGNSFKNITILAGNVVLGLNDAYKNFFYQPPSTLLVNSPDGVNGTLITSKVRGNNP